MLTIRGGKTASCLPIAADSDEPASTSSRTAVSTLRNSTWVLCSARIVSAFSNDRPELTMVANWREKMARSLRPTRLACMPDRLISRCSPRSLTAVMRTGVKPVALSR